MVEKFIGFQTNTSYTITECSISLHVDLRRCGVVELQLSANLSLTPGRGSCKVFLFSVGRGCLFFEARWHPILR
ncbi:unnamed protein product [Victoria cruziana]